MNAQIERQISRLIPTASKKIGSSGGMISISGRRWRLFNSILWLGTVTNFAWICWKLQSFIVELKSFTFASLLKDIVLSSPSKLIQESYTLYFWTVPLNVLLTNFINFIFQLWKENYIQGQARHFMQWCRLRVIIFCKLSYHQPQWIDTVLHDKQKADILDPSQRTRKKCKEINRRSKTITINKILKGIFLKWVTAAHFRITLFLRPAIHFSYFAVCGYFANVFVKHTTKYETLTIHFLYFMRISCFINATKK